ncbi:MAG: hypothetical protein AB1324_05110 [Candidatus Micrarchaeota archaeon]
MIAQKPPERIRGPNLAVFITKANGVPMEEAIQRADEAGLVVASNKRLDKALVRSEEWKQIRDVFLCWTGTFTGYEAPGQKLGKIIESTDSKTGIRYVFPVPEENQGKKNIILVTEHPDFTLVKDGNDRIVQAVTVDAVEKFPTSGGGLFRVDPKYDIPQGNMVIRRYKSARCLWRTIENVGLVVRGVGGPGLWPYVLLGCEPSSARGVAVESP